MRKSVHNSPAAAWSLHGAAGQRKYLNADERARFIAAAHEAAPSVRTLCLTLAYTGCRLSEALGLTLSDIDTAGGVVAIHSLKKRGRTAVREVPAPPALLADLAAVYGLPGHDPAAAERRLWPWGRTYGWMLVKRIMAKAGICRLPASPKGLRHAFGVHAMRSGVPLTLIRKWLGHVDIATTSIYLDVLGADERAIAERMWDVQPPSSKAAAESQPKAGAPRCSGAQTIQQ